MRPDLTGRGGKQGGTLFLSADGWLALLRPMTSRRNGSEIDSNENKADESLTEIAGSELDEAVNWLAAVLDVLAEVEDPLRQRDPEAVGA